MSNVGLFVELVNEQKQRELGDLAEKQKKAERLWRKPKRKGLLPRLFYIFKSYPELSVILVYGICEVCGVMG